MKKLFLLCLVVMSGIVSSAESEERLVHVYAPVALEDDEQCFVTSPVHTRGFGFACRTGLHRDWRGNFILIIENK